MRDLFRAEWIKVSGNRWVAGCLIWIFPVGALAFIIVVALILALSSTARSQYVTDTLLWTEQAVGIWNVPNNPIGRLILLSFTAVVFGGEYQWHTWKNVIPRQQRTALILIKFLALGVFVVFAFVLMSIIMAVGTGVLVAIAGGTYGPKITGKVLLDFAHDYTLQASLAFTSTIIAAGYAALAGMFTRSILGGVLVGFAATFVEGLSILGLALIAFFLDIPRIVYLYRFTPSYNLLNVSSWINDKRANPLDLELGKHVIHHADSLTFSLVVLAVWVAALISLTVFLFRRQDITS